MDKAALNVALLIDADNASAATIDPVLTVLAELGTVNVRRVYGNWSKPALKGWRDMSIRHGIEPQQQFDLTKGKNATDMKMTIDAMDLLARGRVEGFGIMSSDSDFMPLAMRIRQDGIPVYGFGTSRTPEGFRQACTRFIDVSALIGGVADDEPGDDLVATLAATPATTTTIRDTLPPAIGSRPAQAKPRRKQVDEDVLKLLSDAYDAVKQDKQGFASLSALGQHAGNRSSFDTRNYGYSRLSDLVEDMPSFQVERRDAGVFVKRLR